MALDIESFLIGKVALMFPYTQKSPRQQGWKLFYYGSSAQVNSHRSAPGCSGDRSSFQVRAISIRRDRVKQSMQE